MRLHRRLFTIPTGGWHRLLFALSLVLVPWAARAQAPITQTYSMYDLEANPCTVTLSTSDNFTTATVIILDQGQTWTISDLPIALGIDGGLWISGENAAGTDLTIHNLNDGVLRAYVSAGNADPSDPSDQTFQLCQ